MYKVQANLTPNQAQTGSRIFCSNAKSDQNIRVRANLHDKTDGIPENRNTSSLSFSNKKPPENVRKASALWVCGLTIREQPSRKDRLLPQT